MGKKFVVPEGFSLDENMTVDEIINDKNSIAQLASNGKAGAKLALHQIFMYAGFGGAHHKDWLIDQVVQALTGKDYKEFIRSFEDGEDGPDTYSWDEGIAP